MLDPVHYVQLLRHENGGLADPYNPIKAVQDKVPIISMINGNYKKEFGTDLRFSDNKQNH